MKRRYCWKHRAAPGLALQVRNGAAHSCRLVPHAHLKALSGLHLPSRSEVLRGWGPLLAATSLILPPRRGLAAAYEVEEDSPPTLSR